MTKNLGTITEPLLIFGGPYSNLQALKALHSIAQEREIPAERCICTGDIVAYCAQPKETVAFIREWGVHCLMGNCEESFAAGSEDCGCGFDEGTQCDLLSAQWFNYANTQLGNSERQWFASLPRQIRFDYNGKNNSKNGLVVHGSVSSINQFIFESTDIKTFTEEFELANKIENTDIILGGHCGIPFTKKINDKVWHNAGAIGIPANDGTPRTWYSIIDSKNNQMIFETHEINYNHQETQNAMITSGMDNGYAKALSSGLWPSMDVLPESERDQQGVALPAKTLFTHD
jgi:predicted phosphodiesterase